MPTAKMLTDEELQQALQRARDTEKRARARIARLKRASDGASRRLDTQRKCAVGGVLFALAARDSESDRRLVAYVKAYLEQHPPHDSNRAALAGTPFAIPDTKPEESHVNN